MESTSAVAQVGIPAIALLSLSLLLFLVWKAEADPAARRRTLGFSALAAALWFGGTLSAAWSGRLADFDARPPPLMFVMGGTFILGFAVGFSPLGRKLSFLPIPLLIASQAIRFPLELVMHRAATDGVMPVQLSFGGWNFDIVVGGLALPVAWWVARTGSRAAAGAWLMLSWLTIAAIAFIAIGSAPWFGVFGHEPQFLNTWVAHAPYVWLPAGPVVFALIVQTALARRLLGGAPAGSSTTGSALASA